MDASAILAILLGIMCLWLGIRVQQEDKVNLRVITQKELKNNVEKEYRRLHGRIFLLNSLLLLTYGVLLIAEPSWMTFKVKIVYALLIVIVNEGLRHVSRKYYVS